MLQGMLLFSKSYHRDEIQLSTECRGVAKLYSTLLYDVIHLQSSVTTRAHHRGGHEFYTLTVDDQDDRRRILERFPSEMGFGAPLEEENATKQIAYICGAFLASGSVSDPAKTYRLEFVCPTEELALELADLLSGFDLTYGFTDRRGMILLYTKDSQIIEDTLTLIGAGTSALELMNIKIFKSVRNKANRETNCETANLDKTVTAASAQGDAIRLLQERGVLPGLTEELQHLAHLRLSHPEYSLRELAQELGMSRSGINHRLKKLMAIAQELREQSGSNENE